MGAMLHACMKLLIFTQKVDSTDDNLGFFHRWIGEFARRCESVIVVCLYEGHHELPKNVRVLSLGKEGGASRWKYLKRFYSYIWRERRNYDAVFVHMNQVYVILGGLLWRMIGKRIGLWYAHGSVSWTLFKATLLSHSIFTSTPEGFRIPTKKLHVVGQGIDVPLFSQKSSYAIADSLRIVTLGRIAPSKDLETVIHAIAMLKERNVLVVLTIAGSAITHDDMLYRVHLEKVIKEKGLMQDVVFAGAIPYADLPSFLPKYDIFVNVGKTGSLDKAVLDAMAAGVPVVIGNPAFKDMLASRSDLLMCAPESPEALAAKCEAISRLSSDERRETGTWLREIIIQGHSLEGLVGRILTALTS